jgi:hypothetical protein
MKRGEHGRHKVRKKVHAIHKIGAHGEPLEPKEVIGKFSNQCSCIAREYVPITYFNWKKVPADIKGVMWGEVLRRFRYPEDQFDEDLCKTHALSVAGKAMRNLRTNLNTEFVKKGKEPFQKYNFIKKDVWEEFVEKVTSKEAKEKGEKFSELAKRNTIPHHLGVTGYAGKRKQWEEEEKKAAEAGQKNPLEDVSERGRHYFYARRPKKLKEGMSKYNEPQTEEAEKALLAVAEAKRRGEFQPRRDHDELTEALGNPEHRGRVRGVSSMCSWKSVDKWQSDSGSSFHTRQGYKQRLIEQGREEAMKELIMGSIQEAFTSTDPKMVELRAQMLTQAGLQLPRAQEGQTVSAGTSQQQRYPADEIVEPTMASLEVPWGRAGKKKYVAEGEVQPPDPYAIYNGKPIPPDYAVVSLGWVCDEHEHDELDYPSEDGATTLKQALGFEVLWNKADMVFQASCRPSQRSSPPGDPDDSSDDGGDDKDGDGPGRSPGHSFGGQDKSPERSPPVDTSHPQDEGSSPARSPPANTSHPQGEGSPPHGPPADTSNPQGDREVATANATAPASGDQEAKWSGKWSKPDHLTVEQWAAYLLAESFQYTWATKRYLC